MKSIVCPICGGPINKKWFVKIDAYKPDYALFVAECWSGDLHKESTRHYFEIRVKLPNPVEIDQMKVMEEKLEELRRRLAEITPSAEESRK